MSDTKETTQHADDEVSDAFKMLIARMETHPDEFIPAEWTPLYPDYSTPNVQTPRWGTFIQYLKSPASERCVTNADRAAFLAALDRLHAEQMCALIVKAIINNEDLIPPLSAESALGKYTSLLPPYEQQMADARMMRDASLQAAVQMQAEKKMQEEWAKRAYEQGMKRHEREHPKGAPLYA